MKTPVIFLAFANDQDEHLSLLGKERKSISQTLWEHEDNQQIKLVAESETSIEDVFAVFRRYKDQVAIFHYGGHASGTHLRLEDGEKGSADTGAEGLAQFFGSEESLKLVFLNGCATKTQVDTLFKNGVKAVIATSTKIEDTMAKEFSEQFYFELAAYSSIRRAFAVASSFVSGKYHAKTHIKTYRGLSDSWDEDGGSEDQLPWTLFTAEGYEDIVDWKIPNTMIQIR